MRSRRSVVDSAGELAHEFRTPLTSVRGAIGLVLGGACGELDPRAKDMLEIAQANCDRLGRLVEDVLEAVGAGAGAVASRTEVMCAGDAVRRAMLSMEPYAAERGVSLLLDVAERIPKVFADPDRIEQVVVNLISNAVKFSPRGGRVEVSASAFDGHVRVSVADDGPGVPDDEKPRVFERFFRGRHAGGPGSGLGLTISRTIIERVGGSIFVRDREPAGSVFEFNLPACEGE